MTDKRFAFVGEPEDRLIEECAELQQALCKAKRFGWFSRHPDYPNGADNLEAVKREMDDVVEAMERLEVKLRAVKAAHYSSENEHENPRR